MKKALAVILSIVIIFGWYVTLAGIGSFAPTKDQMKLGLDLKGITIKKEALYTGRCIQ